MPEYDAFGREIGEDTLADSGWTAGQSPEVAQPAPVPQPLAPGDPLQPPPAPTPTATQQVAEAGFRDVAAVPLVTKRRAFGCGSAVGLVMLLVVGAIGAGIFLLASTAEDAIDDATRLIPKIPTIDVPNFTVPTPQAPAPADPAAKPPKGLRRESLLKRANFARAMRRLRAARLGNLRSVRVAPDRIDVQLLTKGGALRHAQIRYDGALQKFGSATPGFGHLDTFPYSSVNTAVPERLTRAAAKRLGKGADNVDYLVKIGFSDQLDWAIFFKGGANFQADSAGRIVRRIS